MEFYQLNYQVISLFSASHFWVIEELCNGCSLAMAMSQDAPIPEPLIRNCALQLTRALHHVHSSGVVVRNLHPHKVRVQWEQGKIIEGFEMGSSLLYSSTTVHFVTCLLKPQVYIDSKGNLKLGGLLMGCDLTRPSEENVTPALSPLYCCPEALLHNTWSYASDLWSLGAILYHMYTGLLLLFSNRTCY